jgi:hypothetical protein
MIAYSFNANIVHGLIASHSIPISTDRSFKARVLGSRPSRLTSFRIVSAHHQGLWSFIGQSIGQNVPDFEARDRVAEARIPLGASVGIVRRHAGHAVTEQGLTQLIVDTQPLQAGGERMPKVVKPEVLDSDPSSCFEPIAFERSGVGPIPKDAAVRHRGDVLHQGAQGDPVQGHFFGIA